MRKRNILGILLIIAGIVIFMIPVGWNLYVKYEQKQMMEQLKREIAQNLLEEQAAEDAMATSDSTSEPTLSESPTPMPTAAADAYANLELEEAQPTDEDHELKQSDTVKEILKYQKLIGIIEIDRIDIIFPIAEGAERANIRASIGHIKGTAGLGKKGNCVLAGHRGGIYGVFFKHIDKLKNGDIVEITNLKGKEFKYKVYDKFVVEPTDMYVIDPIKDETTLTLVSCEDEGTRRLIVRCRLED